MAIAGINWLGSKLGVDITGTEGKNRGDGMFDRLSATLFQTEKEKDEIPEDAWGYVYNDQTKIWEPDANAPEWAWQEHRERLANPTDVHGKPLKKAEVAPPPPPPAPTTFLSSPQATGKYVDCFSGGSAAPPPVAPPAYNADPAPPAPGGVVESTPQDLIMLKATPSQVTQVPPAAAPGFPPQQQTAPYPGQAGAPAGMSVQYQQPPARVMPTSTSASTMPPPSSSGSFPPQAPQQPSQAPPTLQRYQQPQPQAQQPPAARQQPPVQPSPQTQAFQPSQQFPPQAQQPRAQLPSLPQPHQQPPQVPQQSQGPQAPFKPSYPQASHSQQSPYAPPYHPPPQYGA